MLTYPNVHNLSHDDFTLNFRLPLVSTPSSTSLPPKMMTALQLRQRHPASLSEQANLESNPSSSSSLSSSSNDQEDFSAATWEEITFSNLPIEIHLLIIKELTYPDALSLKHTSRYFYGLVDTGIQLKVEWLMERRMLHLDCPNDKKCILKTDLEFCRGSVRYVIPYGAINGPSKKNPKKTCWDE